MYCAVSVTGELMEVNLIFKIAAVGILITILGQVLKHSGREEHAFLISLAGLVLVLSWIVPYIYDLFDMIQSALDETLMNTKQLYVLYDDAGKLTLKNINTMKLNLLIDEETGENFSYESSIDEQTYNKIKLAYNNEKTGKRELFIAQDGAKMNQWGVLQYFEEVQKRWDEEERKLAENIQDK